MTERPSVCAAHHLAIWFSVILWGQGHGSWPHPGLMFTVCNRLSEMHLGSLTLSWLNTRTCDRLAKQLPPWSCLRTACLSDMNVLKCKGGYAFSHFGTLMRHLPSVTVSYNCPRQLPELHRPDTLPPVRSVDLCSTLAIVCPSRAWMWSVT